jgi:hypothetical protein
MAMKKTEKSPEGVFPLFVFRGWGQATSQATVERAPGERPLPIPRSGTSAPIGAPTMIRRPIPPER